MLSQICGISTAFGVRRKSKWEGAVRGRTGAVCLRCERQKSSGGVGEGQRSLSNGKGEPYSFPL